MTYEALKRSLLLNTLLSFVVSLFVYIYLANDNPYSNLSEFYVGQTIFSNYSKQLDVNIFFYYILIFFLCLPLSSKVCRIFFTKKPYSRATLTIIIFITLFILLREPLKLELNLSHVKSPSSDDRITFLITKWNDETENLVLPMKEKIKFKVPFMAKDISFRLDNASTQKAKIQEMSLKQAFYHFKIDPFEIRNFPDSDLNQIPQLSKDLLNIKIYYGLSIIGIVFILCFLFFVVNNLLNKFVSNLKSSFLVIIENEKPACLLLKIGLIVQSFLFVPSVMTLNSRTIGLTFFYPTETWKASSLLLVLPIMAILSLVWLQREQIRIASLVLSLFNLLILLRMVPPYYVNSLTLPVASFPVITIFCCILIIAGIYNIIQHYLKNIDTIPAFSYIALLIILINNNYNVSQVPSDFYHFGEGIVNFWRMDSLLEVAYKDFYLPHGFIDVSYNYIGKYMFQDSTISGTLFGVTFLTFLVLILSFMLLSRVSLSFAFFSTLAMLLFIPRPHLLLYVGLFIFSYDQLIYKRPHWWQFFFTICSAFYLYLLEPTFGAPWILGSLFIMPLAISRLLEFYSLNGKIIFICCFVLLCSVLIHMNYELLLNNFKFILLNLESNLPSFGNMGSLKPTGILKISGFLLVPVFIFLGLADIIKHKKLTNFSAFYFFNTIFIICISKYSLGRLDGEALPRAASVSYPIIFCCLPYLLIKKDYKNITLFIIAILTLPSIPYKAIAFNGQRETIFENSNLKAQSRFAAFSEKQLKQINFLKGVTSNKTFLDFTNRSTFYYLLQKRPPTKFLAYYNVGHPAFLDKKTLEQLPDVILFSKDAQNHDNLSPALRVSQLFNQIISSNEYSLAEHEDFIYLTKTSNPNLGFSDLKKIETLGTNLNLAYLPDAWGGSLELLKSKTTKQNILFTIQNINEMKYIIKFKSPQSFSTIDFIHIETANIKKSIQFKISSNNEDDESPIFYISTNAQVLVPFYCYPSWRTKKKIPLIIIKGDQSWSPKDVSFMKFN